MKKGTPAVDPISSLEDLREPFGESEIITLLGFAGNDAHRHSGAGFNKVEKFVANS
jgi:hypothetical protein